MLTMILQGFSAGMPLLLVGSTLQAWMKDAGVDLKTIGLFALIGLPYSLKFLWSPLLDRYAAPLLSRRRGWIFIFQLLLLTVFFLLGAVNPVENTWIFTLIALFVALFSASQDIVIDAYRREALSDEELGLGSSLYVNGYRLALLAAGAFALYLADQIEWKYVYWTMGAIMGLCSVTTLFAPLEDEAAGTPKSLKEAVVEPFLEFFKRKDALLMLIFILLYKIGDSMGAHMSMPLYLDLGFSKTQIAGIAKLFGFWATIGGALVGGVLMLKLGINKSLWVFGSFQALSTFGFSILAKVGASSAALAGVITVENLASGMGTAAYTAYMASITNKKFTATQYALLTSLMSVPRVIASAPTGYMVEWMGWFNFYLFCTLIAVPGMLLLFKIAPWSGKETA